MNLRILRTGGVRWLGVTAFVLLFLAGCSTTPKINWNERIGTFSWNDALAELGQPNRVTELEGGVKSAEWVTTRGLKGPTQAQAPIYAGGEIVNPDQTSGWNAPDKVLRLMFTPDGKLFDWNANY